MGELDLDTGLVGDHRRYHVTAILGQGGFGTVYRARMEGTGGFHKDVALKILRDADPPAEVLSRFRDEARILGLVRNPHVVGVDPPVRLGGRWAVVMEFVDGASCEEVLASGPFPPTVALEVAEVVALTLHELFHAADGQGGTLQLVHRDLKPSNLQLTPTGHVKLLDFGVARARFADRETSTVAGLGGTPGYIAPERLEGHDSAEGDVWSLGVVLHRLVTGERPPSPAGETSESGALRLVHDPAVEAVTAFAARLRDSNWRQRPTAEQVAASCRSLRTRLGGTPTLREWAREHVPAAPRRPPDALVGQTLSETLVAPRPERQERRTSPWFAVGVLSLGGSVGAGFLGVLLVVAAVAWLSTRPAPLPEPPRPAPLEVAGAAPTHPPAPEPRPAPAPEPTPEPAPEPVQSALPAPAALVTDAPVPAPPPAPPAPARATGQVSVDGDATRVELVCDGRAYATGSPVPAGSCTIRAVFGGGAPTPAGTVVVPAGGVVKLSCASSFQRCRVR